MDALLLCGYRPEEELGLQIHPSGELILDVQIARLQEMGLSPIVILAGAGADEQVRRSRLLESCDLVFDAHDKDANIYTNIRSGLYATQEACFVLPVEIPAPPMEAWKHLKTELTRAGFRTPNHVFQLATSEGAPWHHGFPLLMTVTGRRCVLEIETDLGLRDERLRYSLARLSAGGFTGLEGNGSLATGSLTA